LNKDKRELFRDFGERGPEVSLPVYLLLQPLSNRPKKYRITRINLIAKRSSQSRRPVFFSQKGKGHETHLRSLLSPGMIGSMRLCILLLIAVPGDRSLKVPGGPLFHGYLAAAEARTPPGFSIQLPVFSWAGRQQIIAFPGRMVNIASQYFIK